MGEQVKITCDSCERDLTYTGNCEDYRLILSYESKLPWYYEHGETCGAVTDMGILPPINRKHVFCDMGCLEKWMDKKK